ncbi:hypothetical protein QCD71_25260, partial [Sphingomonas sp. PsM26]|nr:hypothetical protein [Sphingomonas sp. PsM26]
MDHAPAIAPSGQPLDDEGELTKLHPGYAHALRVRTTLTAIPFLIGALVLETVFLGQGLFPSGVIAGT